MRLFALLFTLLLALPAVATDYAREKKWADEVLPSVMTGDPVWLEVLKGPHSGRKFLTLYTEAPEAKAGVIVVHGMGVHPDWGLIGPLRQNLPELGYATLSVQMPVLQADAKGEDYPATFDEAAARIAQAVAFMEAKGYKKIVLVSHSMGSRMTARYLEKTPDAPIQSWVAIGASEALDYSKLKFPVLDLYGENDLPQVLKAAAQRGKSLRGKSTQIVVPKADHFFEGRDKALLENVRGFLDKAL
ncbi:MAG: alpha/beta hydrolase family protein [Gammaproteobacteria bacterium]|nr:alpha/beta hydrolase family protein [Gammaproteobacteria bacterium]